MKFRESLSNASFSPHLASDTKNGVIEEMLDLMVADGKIKDRAGVLAALPEREKTMSTGMQNGIAIPHAKTDLADDLVTALALKPAGIDFASLDGEVSRIFVMTISPASEAGPHMQYLGEISKCLTDAKVREELLSAKNLQDVVRVMLGEESTTSS